MNTTLRLGVIGAVFFALLGILTLRLWTMQVTEVHAYEERAESNQIRVVHTPAPRGDVYDANGVLLAGTRSSLNAVVDLALVDQADREQLAQNLAAFLDQPASDIIDAMENDHQGGLLTVAEDLSEHEATFIVERREEFPGVSIIPQPVRTYPLGETAAHVLGYIGKPNATDLEDPEIKSTDLVGKAGVERSYDAVLRGTEGVIKYQVDSKRKVLALSGEEAPSAGGSLILTIDSDVQSQLQASLEDGLRQARLLEMEERREELDQATVRARLVQAEADAEFEARQQAAAEATEEETTTTAAAGVDDDDVANEPSEPDSLIDPFDVLGPLHPSLPIDDEGMCIPVERVTVAVGESGPLSGREPRFISVRSIDEVDGELVATVSIGLETETVELHQRFGGTLQVYAITEDSLIVYHSDAWCPVRSVGVVLDPSDGSVLAMASYPDYDPTVFIGGLSTDIWEDLGTIGAFQNFAVQGQYAPASAFKTVPYVLALEENYYPLDRGFGDKEVGEDSGEEGSADEAPKPLVSDIDEYSCSGEFKFTLNDGTVQTKRDWKWPSGHGPLDLHGALQASCDLYFWDMALRLWNDRTEDPAMENLLQEYARGFGFGTETGIDLPFEKAGLIPDRAWFREEQRNETGRVREGSWVGGDLMDIAVGQGATLSTPLQLANGYAAMVNGGTVWQPRVVSEVQASDGTIEDEFPPQVLNTVDLNPGTVRMLKEDLQQVVGNTERGTARSAFADFGENVEIVGGKTGTGEVIQNRDEPFKQVDNAVFVGVAPINSPDYVISVIVERGGSGGRVAAPIARQVLQYLVNGAGGVTELAPGLDAD